MVLSIDTSRKYASTATKMKQVEDKIITLANPNLFSEFEYDYEDDEEIFRQLANW